MGDVLGLKHSLHRHPREAKGFYAIFAGLLLVSAVIVIIPGSPLGLLTEGVQTLAGVLLPSATVFLLMLCNDRDVLGPWTNSRRLNVFASIVIAVLVMLSIVLTASVLFPDITSAQIVAILAGGTLLTVTAGGYLAWASRGTGAPSGHRPVAPGGDRSTWRMPPRTLLNRAPLSVEPACRAQRAARLPAHRDDPGHREGRPARPRPLTPSPVLDARKESTMNTVNTPAPQVTTGNKPTLVLSELLRRTALDAAGNTLGKISDVIVSLNGEDYPRVIGLSAQIGGRDVFIPAEQILAWHTERLELATARVDLRPFQRRDDEVLLRADVLGHRVVDLSSARLVTAHDVLLAHVHGDWAATAVDVHPRGLRHRKGAQTWRDWKDVEALIGRDTLHTGPLGRLRRLKPADLANLIESATGPEQEDLLSRVRVDPELEADVFEELDEDEAGDILEERTDQEIADVLSRMRADDAVDALMDLPQRRRKTVLELVPPVPRNKINVLLGYQPATAGGLMGMDYLCLHEATLVAGCLDAVRAATALQPEALSVVYLHDADDKLVGAVGLVALIQADPARPAAELADDTPIHVHPDADLSEISVAMADYNLLVLPVLDPEDRLLGVIIIDDILEAAIEPETREMLR